MLELIADYARIKYGPSSYELTEPSTPAAARYAAVQRFNGASTTAAGEEGGKPFLYLITPRSIGLGTQLQGLSAAIVFESDWHPRLDIQALHRWVGLHDCMYENTLCVSSVLFSSRPRFPYGCRQVCC
jgi:SNF2 family DNA or RNA helicase